MKKVTVAVMIMCVMALSGCSAMKSGVHDLNGSISGNTYTIDCFDNYGEMQMQTHGEKIDIDGNVVKTKGINSDGISEVLYELSSVVTLTIDGHEMESCGDTLIFYEDGLEPDVAFEPGISITSSADGIMDSTMIAGRLNKVKNLFGKSRVVVIKSQLGNPIYAFSGDEVYWTIPDDLPKFTKLMVDGKALYVHRANFQIIDKELLQ